MTADPRSVAPGEQPRLGDRFPELAARIESLLRTAGEAGLAATVADLRVWAPCGCGEPWCLSFRTEAPASARAYPDRRRYRCLDFVQEGRIVLDVLDDRIVYIEHMAPVGDTPPDSWR